MKYQARGTATDDWVLWVRGYRRLFVMKMSEVRSEATFELLSALKVWGTTCVNLCMGIGLAHSDFQSNG